MAKLSSQRIADVEIDPLFKGLSTFAQFGLRGFPAGGVGRAHILSGGAPARPFSVISQSSPA